MTATTTAIRYEHFNVLPKLVEEGWITKRKHPHFDLWIYNYTPQATFKQYWQGPVMDCRGLILTADGEIIGRPFRKFFDIDHQPLPDEPFEIHEKMDGSLLIVCSYNGERVVATRGSFISEMAYVGADIINRSYPHFYPSPGVTYCFEVIYPANRIVVNYGKKRGIVHLATIDNETGKDLPFKDVGIPQANRVAHISSPQDLVRWMEENPKDNEEGFIIKFAGGLRVKVKYEEYRRMHRILYGTSTLSIWEALMNGTSIDDVLDRVPAEFKAWVERTKSELLEKHSSILRECHEFISTIPEGLDRKQEAEFVKPFKYWSMVFSILRKKTGFKSAEQMIWRMIRPEFSKPFREEPTE